MADPRKRLARSAGGSGANLIVSDVEARESFKVEALALWAEYQATELHLTGREMAD